MTDIVERLKYGVIEYPKRWSGDTHTDLGGSVDYEANKKMMDEAAAEITRLRAKVAKADELEDAFIGVAASLSAAIYLLEKGGRAAAPSNKMFDQMLKDYKRSLEQARAAYQETNK